MTIALETHEERVGWFHVLAQARRGLVNIEDAKGAADAAVLAYRERLPSGDAPPPKAIFSVRAAIAETNLPPGMGSAEAIRELWALVLFREREAAVQTNEAMRLREELAKGGDAPQEPSALDKMRERYHEAERRVSEARTVTTEGEAWVWSDDDTAASVDSLGELMVVRITGGHLRALIEASRPPGGAEPGLREAMGISDVLAASEGAAPPSEPDPEPSPLAGKSPLMWDPACWTGEDPEAAEPSPLAKHLEWALHHLDAHRSNYHHVAPAHEHALAEEALRAELNGATTEPPVTDPDQLPGQTPDAPGWWWRGETPTEVYDTSDRSEGGDLSFYSSQDGYLDVVGFTWGGRCTRGAQAPDAALDREVFALKRDRDSAAEGLASARREHAALRKRVEDVSDYIASERGQEYARHDSRQRAAYREGLALAAKWLRAAPEVQS